MGATVREELQDEFLSSLRKGQGIALDALKTLVETIQFVAPAMPAVRVPLADRLPAAHEFVAGGYEFAEHLLVNQRQFADEVITAMSPLLPGGTAESAVKSAARHEVKHEVKPAVKHEVKPAVKHEVKPAAEPAIKAAVKPAIKAAVKPAAE